MPDGPRQGEMLVAASDGRWLGDFSALYVAPYHNFRTGFVEVPVGWTWLSSSETSGCDRSDADHQPGGGCICSDCCGSHERTLITQRTVGQTIDPCLTNPFLDGFGIAAAPMECVDGCSWQLLEGRCICGARDTVSCRPPTPATGTQTAAGYPLTNVGTCNASAGISVIEDSSGPDGLEDLPAMQIDFMGSGAEGATFVGENGGYDPGRPSPVGGFSSPPLAKHRSSDGTIYIAPDDGPGGLNTGRSNTGINIYPGDCLTFDFWAKAVPDRFGNTCIGYDLGTRISSATGQYLIPPGFGHSLSLNGDWQHYDSSFTLEHSPPGFADPLPYLESMITIMTGHTNTVDAFTGCGTLKSRVRPPRGRVLIKAVHLTPCSPVLTTPVHVWRHH